MMCLTPPSKQGSIQKEKKFASLEQNYFLFESIPFQKGTTQRMIELPPFMYIYPFLLKRLENTLMLAVRQISL